MRDAADLAYMEMAYGLAEKARGRASPNPYVGSVIVRRNAIAGYGYHEETGKPHAEIVAMRRAGSRTRGATVYITLEPCVHWGRTPPCVDSLIEAKPRRVVVSAYDPNPVVFKKGVRKLHLAGIKVTAGLLAEKNVRLNEAYNKFITRRIPFVAAKAALSMDGKMAARTMDSRWISARETREYVHLLRGEYDAVMAGIGTVLHDDPILTVRHSNWKNKKIARVILDSRLRFPLDARLLSTVGDGPLLIFTGKGIPSRKKEDLEKRGAEVIPLDAPPKTGMHAVLCELGKRDISSVLVEGGSRLLTSIIDGRLADKIYLTLSPILIGGEQAPLFYGGEGVDRVRDSLRLRNTSLFRIGEDTILEGYF
ncbi:MAG TPA: bifunctional diaminohydroxyphosphoribosylaminopyrimidine deaminase/5-amino-6-(5-phosphoribosylamino)uracil reductase RibD [Candidatus Aminicenantes bacterium]|nr:bifunctional diaminohydroxyphosphoribosylaminopyrimidine deaminase/5-amino-6-(5-phosphoribosylamino)uracil reductase RibD [Candidatus Aminicenantes bacterium]